MGFWWFVHILVAILGRVVSRMAMGVGDDPEITYLVTLNGVAIAAVALGILLNILTLVIVQRFARCQRETNEKIIDDFV